MLTVAALVAEGALARAESRGTHFRSDRPERDDAGFCRRIYLDRTEHGTVRTTLGPLHPPTDRPA